MLTKITRTFVATIVTAFGLAVIGAPIADAGAPIPRWNKTNAKNRRVLVQYCNGDIAGINPGKTVTKDVCAFYAVYADKFHVKVKETGTVLFNFTHCNDARWIRFSDKTDTSRTAVVTTTDGSCGG